MTRDPDRPMPARAMLVIRHYLDQLDVAQRIIRSLPDCLTPTAIDEIKLHLGAVLNDDEALAEFCELVDR